MRQLCQQWRRNGESIALVPTMGYYHAGHESLMKYGRDHADRLVVSLFVNPAQFGPNEDLDAYPRDFDRDSAIARAQGADALYFPSPESMYAADHGTWVEVPEMARGLCGQQRPVHFRGVCTVVMKLFLITMPDIAIFGEKDWQQQAILKRMARDLNVPVEIVSRPAVRETDGLAMSSRNVYLSEEERKQAPYIRKGLLLARELASAQQLNGAELIRTVKDYWRQNMPDAEIDYISLVDPSSLTPLETIGKEALLACAVRLGKARLIDNILIKNIATN